MKAAETTQKILSAIEQYESMISPNPIDYQEVETSFLKATLYHRIPESCVPEFFSIAEELCDEVIESLEKRISDRTDFFLFEVSEVLDRELKPYEENDLRAVVKGSYFYLSTEEDWEAFLERLIDSFRVLQEQKKNRQ